jgi:hypothetical protein
VLAKLESLGRKLVKCCWNMNMKEHEYGRA